ncbi:MAG: GNAT family N-acetyltransferase [Betaproteobacteria bacterium]
MHIVACDTFIVRALTRDDLAAVVAIDAAIEGRARQTYVERRLAVAIKAPNLHAQLAAVDEDGVAGYILARVLEGEFGRVERGLRIEMIGVRADIRGHHVGQQLLAALVTWGRRHGVQTLRTAAAWNDHPMLKWLDAMAFTRAPEGIVECALGQGTYMPEREDAISLAATTDATREIDFGRLEHNDYERLTSNGPSVRTMGADDLESITRIDAGLTGRRRDAYIRNKLDEAMTDAGIRMSLTARIDDRIVGYLMARADLGDFGRTEPVAVVDTIGVDPDARGRGAGRALLAQLFSNLAALKVERVETVVAPRDLDLLGFLYDAGFVASQRLAFIRPLAP